MNNKYKFHRRFFLFFIFSSFFPSYSQVNLSFDRDCMIKNSSILSQLFIESLGKDTVIKLLEDDFRIVLLTDVDSLGRVMNCRKVFCKKKLPDSLEKKITSIFMETNKRFFICYELPPGKNNDEAHQLVAKHLFVTKKSELINISFPGEFMSYYEGKNRKLNLTKYEYLQRRMTKYL